MVLNLLNRIISLFNLSFKIRGTKKVESAGVLKLSLDEIINNHFSEIGEPNHLCKESMKLALSLIDDHNDVIILETGSSAWGTNSSVLFDRYLNNRYMDTHFNGLFKTCDIRINPMLSLYNKVSNHTILFCSDSVKFLRQEAAVRTSSTYLIYLDSFDLNYISPNPSGLHGFKELLEVIPLMKRGTVLLIDDSPFSLDYCPENVRDVVVDYLEKYGTLPGKGMFIDPVISKFSNVRKVFHKYQIVYLVE